MRRIETTIYRFSELSPEAQERAMNDFNLAEPYSWSEESLASITALAKHFNGRLTDYSIDWLEPGRSYFRFDMPDDMSAKAIREKLRDLGTYNKRTGKGHGECKLTGFCMDEDCTDGFRLAWRRGERSLADLMHAAGEELLSSCCRDYEYQLSREAFAETCEANDYEFTELGVMV